MFDMGFQEVVLIGIIALIIIGPERLPSVARSIGLWVGKMQRFVAGVKSDIANELQTDELRSMLSSQEDQIRELKNMVNETKSDLEKTAQQAQKSVSEGMDSAVDQVKDAAETAKENSSKMQDIARSAGYNTYGDIEDSSESSSAANPASKTIDKPDSKDQDPEQSA